MLEIWKNTVFDTLQHLVAKLWIIINVIFFSLLVDWIVQYNPPTTTADYVHRVGRTARIGAKGSSLIFMLPSEANFVKGNLNMLSYYY